MSECCSSRAGAGSGTCCGSESAARSAIRVAAYDITLADRFGHALARLGVNRSGRRVEPGLYSLGDPTPDSPVFVTANYTLSFDALRSSVRGIDSYVLVLDTKGINVWCAAGKGTFGTDELVRRIEAARLADVVSHRELIVPQLGATGVSAHEVKRRSGFNVRYGPVRATDLPEFLKTGEATREMRTVEFPLRDRVVLIPVELNYALLPSLVVAVLLYLLSGPIVALSFVASMLAGTVLFPILLPWLPTPNFSTMGLLLGVVVALPFAAALAAPAAAAEAAREVAPAWSRWGHALAVLLVMPQVTAFLSLNFTGATTFTSRTGVKREILSYFPRMVWLTGAGIVMLLVLAVLRWAGVY